MNTRIKRLKSQEWALLLSPALLPTYITSTPTFSLKPSDGPTHTWGTVGALLPAGVTPPHTELGGEGVIPGVLQSGLD